MAGSGTDTAPAAGDATQPVLPLFLKLAGKSCLVVGAGTVATGKIMSLVETGAEVVVVAPELDAAVRELAAEQRIRVIERRFRAEDVAGRWLVIAATGERGVNRQVFDACEARAVLVNTVDDAALCTATFPSVVRRGAVVVAVSTGGTSPALAAHLRERIEALLPAAIGRVAEFIRRHRATFNKRLPDAKARRHFWRRALDGPMPELVAQGDVAGAEAHLERLADTSTTQGFVSLVGAGPGDPDLLTLKALNALQRADVVYYDRLVPPAILARCRRDAERIYVGKRRAFHGTRQAEINAMLLAGARAGRRVVRLKGGDPFIFGRGGEEIETLGKLGIHFEVIPGVTAGLGCAAYAGIPLTHRDWAQSVRFVTGHLKDDVVNLDWPELAKPGQTLVVYMGLIGLAQLAQRLIEHGMDAATPAATISRGTLPDQAVVVAPLADIADAVRRAKLPAPTSTIIGRVVALREQLRQA